MVTYERPNELTALRKGRYCDYTPYKEPPRLESHELEPLVVHYEFCSHTDLSSRGTIDLLHVVKACSDDSSSPQPFTSLSEVVGELLELADVDLSVALEEFGPCIQQWCPVLLEDNLRGCAYDLSQQVSHGEGSKSPLLWLCLWLVTKRTCPLREHTSRSELYRAMKQVLAMLQSREELHLEVAQIGMLIAVYEIGHGLQRPASQTLASCIALVRMLGLDARKKSNATLASTVEWLEVSMLMLDRYVSHSPLTF
jgi:hypothetical protein